MKKNIVIGLFVTTLFVQYGLAMQENVKAEKEVVKTKIAESVTEEENKCVEKIVEKVLSQIDVEKSPIRTFLKTFYAETIRISRDKDKKKSSKNENTPSKNESTSDENESTPYEYATVCMKFFLERVVKADETLAFSRVLEALYEKANTLDEKIFSASNICRFTNFIRFVYFTYTEQCLKNEKAFFNLHEENLYQI